MTIHLNGTARELVPGTTVADLLAQLDIAATGARYGASSRVVVSLSKPTMPDPARPATRR